MNSKELNSQPATTHDTVDAIAASATRKAFPLRRTFIQQKHGRASRWCTYARIMTETTSRDGRRTCPGPSCRLTSRRSERSIPMRSDGEVVACGLAVQANSARGRAVSFVLGPAPPACRESTTRGTHGHGEHAPHSSGCAGGSQVIVGMTPVVHAFPEVDEGEPVGRLVRHS